MSGNICRICLNQIEDGYSLFEVYENDMALSEVLNKCLDVKLEKEDGDSGMVCDGCAEVIKKFNNLVVTLNSRGEDLVEIVVEEEVEEAILERYICDVCGKICKREYDLRDHMDSHCKELKYECGVCKKRLKSRTSLSRHEKAHQNQYSFMCEVCGKKFTHASTLQTHKLLLHEKEKKFKCLKCKQCFSLKSTLLKHMMRMHRDKKREAERKFQCDACQIKYLDKSSLNRHISNKHLGKG